MEYIGHPVEAANHDDERTEETIKKGLSVTVYSKAEDVKNSGKANTNGTILNGSKARKTKQPLIMAKTLGFAEFGFNIINVPIEYFFNFSLGQWGDQRFHESG